VPFDTRNITAELFWLMGVVVVVPPELSDPGSVRLSEPEVSVTFDEPVTAEISAAPLQPAVSLKRFKSPAREVLMSRR
jgi:hypothetical protein